MLPSLFELGRGPSIPNQRDIACIDGTTSEKKMYCMFYTMYLSIWYPFEVKTLATLHRLNSAHLFLDDRQSNAMQYVIRYARQYVIIVSQRFELHDMWSETPGHMWSEKRSNTWWVIRNAGKYVTGEQCRRAIRYRWSETHGNRW